MRKVYTKFHETYFYFEVLENLNLPIRLAASAAVFLRDAKICFTMVSIASMRPCLLATTKNPAVDAPCDSNETFTLVHASRRWRKDTQDAAVKGFCTRWRPGRLTSLFHVVDWTLNFRPLIEMRRKLRHLTPFVLGKSFCVLNLYSYESVSLLAVFAC